MAKKSPQNIYVKNMVCDRCIRVVREEMLKLGHDVLSVELGEVVVGKELNETDSSRVRQMLESNGFELIEDKNMKLIESVKTAIIQFVHHQHEKSHLSMKSSEYISKKVGKDYHSLSTLFSSVENVTIEQYIIKQKIERVKELLKYEEWSLSEIAYSMDYSSVQHLSNQFKSVTGLTPTQFKKNTPARSSFRRIPLDKV
ncbi:MAG: helix-turn-helix transcriptional regulator [Bacteroidetes bacterium]|nr:helix-turn-helix transcriptional regulator [Bacteroidota bacterium]